MDVLLPIAALALLLPLLAGGHVHLGRGKGHRLMAFGLARAADGTTCMATRQELP